MENKQLIQHALDATVKARALVNAGKLTKLMGCVGAALETDTGHIFTGINLEFYCSMGFCAEHSAVADMIKHGHSTIKKAVAVTLDGVIIPPCGRCREMMYQVNRESNLKTIVIVGDNKICSLENLLPHRWQESFDASLL